MPKKLGFGAKFSQKNLIITSFREYRLKSFPSKSHKTWKNTEKGPTITLIGSIASPVNIFQIKVDK